MYKETHRSSYAYFYSHLVLIVESHVASKQPKFCWSF